MWTYFPTNQLMVALATMTYIVKQICMSYI